MQSSGLLKPRIIDVQSVSPVQAKVVMEPFERGYGHTLGNALRRILLSSMPGYAPTEVGIDGVLHEYSTVDGVQEDVVDILLNLKGVVFKLHNRDVVNLKLSKEGEGAVRAGDIELPHDVEIINPEHVIAHLSPGGKLAMEIKVEKGRGYVPGNMRNLDDSKTIGKLVLDVIARINAELGTTAVVITHNAAIAGMADRVIRLGDGRVQSIERNATRMSPSELRW